VFSAYQIPVFCPEHYAYYIQHLLKLIISLNKKLQRSQVSCVLHGCSAKYNNYHLSSSRSKDQKSEIRQRASMHLQEKGSFIKCTQESCSSKWYNTPAAIPYKYNKLVWILTSNSPLLLKFPLHEWQDP
jgi:hypothetical protein